MSKSSRTNLGHSLAVSLALATVVALSGCVANPMDILADGANQAVEKVSENENVEAEAALQIDPADIVELPDNFPSEVPLLDGPITSASTLDMRGLGYWSLHIRTEDSTAAMNMVREDLVSTGFAEEKWSENGALVSGLFTTDSYRVAVQSAKDINGYMLLYTVTELAS